MGRIVTLGEIMLRLSSQQGIRLSSSTELNAHYGGGEANVAISMANFGHKVTFASKVPDNSLGLAVTQHLKQYGVDTDLLLKGGPRLGTYYMETGVGERAASVIYDRANSSFALMDNNEWGMDALLKDVDLLHISGITPALSENMTELTLEILEETKKRGIKVSFDVNYRAKLWTQKQAGKVIRQILPYVDYCSAGKMDAIHLLGIREYTGNDEELIYYYQEMSKLFPNIQVFYSTKRHVSSASSNDLQGTLWNGNQYYESNVHHIEPIVDRVGGGDAFASGILHGLLVNDTPQHTVEFATAASALKHTIHGDCNQFSANEVEAFIKNGSGKIIR